MRPQMPLPTATAHVAERGSREAREDANTGPEKTRLSDDGCETAQTGAERAQLSGTPGRARRTGPAEGARGPTCAQRELTAGMGSPAERRIPPQAAGGASKRPQGSVQPDPAYLSLLLGAHCAAHCAAVAVCTPPRGPRPVTPDLAARLGRSVPSKAALGQQAGSNHVTQGDKHIFPINVVGMSLCRASQHIWGQGEPGAMTQGGRKRTSRTNRGSLLGQTRVTLNTPIC